jgi:hypothetical protein
VRYLTIGGRTSAMTDEVARSWDTVVAQAELEAAQYLGYPVVHVRTNRRGIGAIAIPPLHSVTITEEGHPTDPDFGVIVHASTDIDEIYAAVVAEQGAEPEQTDAEVEGLVRELRNDRPDLDWDNLLMGRLAGPASPDRPPVPIWEYLSYAGSHPEVPLSALTAARFPVRYFEGSTSVTSIDEELKPFPSSYKGTPPKPRFPQTPQTVISRYTALHEAGVLAWDPIERGVSFLATMGTYRAVLLAWASKFADEG